MYEVAIVFVAIVCAFCVGWLLADLRFRNKVYKLGNSWTQGSTEIKFGVKINYATYKGPQNAIDAWYAGIAFRTAEMLYDAGEAAKGLSREHNRKLPNTRRRS